jgi:predicted HicB family RNase H-like nuclease
VDIVNHGATLMGRKREKEKTEMEATAPKLRAVRLELSEDEHAALRIQAAKEDVSLMQLARKAVREYLARQKTGGR